MKKNILFLLAVATFIFVGCGKTDQPETCTPRTVESEMPAMTKFATDSSIVTTQDASGLLYQVIEEGTGATPTPTSTVQVNYRGRLMNGTLFEQTVNGPVSFPLNGVIPAWTIALQKIKAGSRWKNQNYYTV